MQKKSHNNKNKNEFLPFNKNFLFVFHVIALNDPLI